MTYEEKVQWCIDQHKNTNHFYDEYLPYEFHLRMVKQVAENFKYLITSFNTLEEIFLACWGHDLIEDARVSYNDAKKVLGEKVADLIYAVTNEKGKNRAQKANYKYFMGILNTPGASFVKLCDRIANVQYSKLTKSSMFEKYKKENEKFTLHLNDSPSNVYREMFIYLNELFL